jgi:hypothetical protein
MNKKEKKKKKKKKETKKVLDQTGSYNCGVTVLAASLESFRPTLVRSAKPQ